MPELVLYGIRLLAPATLYISRPMRAKSRWSSTNESEEHCLLYGPGSAQQEDLSAVDCLPPGLALRHLDVRVGVLVLAATDQEAGDVPHHDGAVAVLTSLG